MFCGNRVRIHTAQAQGLLHVDHRKVMGLLQVALGCLAVCSGGIGRALVYHPLFFRERLGGKAVRKCGDYPPAFVALSYLKSGPVMRYYVCVHCWYPSTLTGLPGYDPIRWIKPVQHPLGLHDPRIRF